MHRFIVGVVASLLVAFGGRLYGEPAVDFDTEIIPVLTRSGCNAGACHGAAIGRGGFKLSLFGSRPADDYVAIVHELGGRRLNLVDGADSLLLRKATETIAHGGGERFDDDSAAYQRIARWIAAGATRGETKRLLRLEIEPSFQLIGAVNQPVAYHASATFDDGSERDVTDWTVFAADDPEAVAIDTQSKLLRVLRPGEHIVVARFLNQVKPFRVAVPFETARTPRQFTVDPADSSDSLIDRLIDAKLQLLNIPASPQSSDEAFARRVWLDLTGRLPGAADLMRFVDDSDPQKRTRLIDRLLHSENFPNYWALKWAGVLAIDSDRLQAEGAHRYHRWIAERLRQDAPWNQSAYLMLSSSGDSYASGPVNFLRSAQGPRELAELATQVFMGVRLRCANCHDHPFDHWTQDDYHGLAAAFARLNRGRTVSQKDRGEVTHPGTGEPARPRIPGEHFVSDETNPRMEFAEWVTASDNPYFARAAVNRIWAQLMGRGLVDPVDDIRSTNPASHPKLLDQLSTHFVDSGFRFKSIIRMICTSRTYGRSSLPLPGNEYDQQYYSHALVRPLEAEVIADAIAHSTGVKLRFAARNTNDSNAKTVQDALTLTDNRVESVALDLLGRCDRSTACETPSVSQSAGSLATVLHLLNGDLLNSRLTHPSGSLHRWLTEKGDDRSVLRTMSLATLSRRPTGAEWTYWNEQMKEARGDSSWPSDASREQFFADVFWALLSSETFATNH